MKQLLIAGLFISASFFVVESIIRASINESKISFKAEFNKSEYYLGEPAYVNFTAIFPIDYPEPQFLHEVLISVEHDNSIHDVGVLEPTMEPPQYLPILPRSSLYENQKDELKTISRAVKLRRSNEIFLETGFYRIKFTLKMKGRSDIESNWIQVSIKMPSGEDRKAYEHLSQFKGGANYEWVWKEDNGIQKLESFVADFPYTEYSESAIFELAGIYYAKGELEKAKSEYEKLASTKNVYILENVAAKLEMIQKRISERNSQPN